MTESELLFNDNCRKTAEYVYKNCPVPGGGFVTGFLFHPYCEDILYVRTDIGGIYRFNFKEQRFECLMDNVTQEDQAACFPITFAIDENNPDMLFAACGCDNSGEGVLLISNDRGTSFTKKPIPCHVHGNNPGRATGERMIFDNGRLYFASQSEGLLISDDLGSSWQKISVCESGNIPEKNLTFIWKNGMYDKINACKDLVIIGASGEGSKTGEKTRGTVLFYSTDDCVSFHAMPAPPAYYDERCDINGFVPQRTASDGRYLYITFTCIDGTIFNNFNCYSCDTGGCFDGRLFRYEIKADTCNSNNISIEVLDITPDADAPVNDKNPDRKLNSGLGGVSVTKDMLITSTIGHKKDDIIYMSKDKGIHWEKLLQGLEYGKMIFDVPYMKPEYNGGGNLIHWLSDLKINPHKPDMALFNTGTGVFASSNLTKALNGEAVKWHSFCTGIEETVHLNVYAPPSGDVKVIDIIGDLGGFAFTDLDTPCENSFADNEGNRYITCLNADFPDSLCSFVAATPRGNWKGKTKGGIIVSHDQCRTFKRLSDPYGISKRLDKFLDHIKNPNVDSGWTACSADAKRIVWCVQGDGIFPSDCVVYTDDEGLNWQKSTFYDLSCNTFDDSPCYVHVYSDRVNPDIFYAVGKASRFFVSTDKAVTFKEIALPSDFPCDMFYKDRSFELRCVPGNEGNMWLALGEGGLYHISFIKEKSILEVTKVTKPGETAYCIGLGKAAPSSPYLTLYTNGRINSAYGFYRSHDNGCTWERINNDSQMFGSIISIDGDKREYGKFYLASGAKGLIYGTPLEK